MIPKSGNISGNFELCNSFLQCNFLVTFTIPPIRILMFDDRIEIENPGGLYGRGTIEKLGKVGLDTRNPYIAGALEIIIDLKTDIRASQPCDVKWP
ncbi:MAG: hypothetical protein FIA99_10910 [Ruminiclostridium sp.]|nr:hypothetical protein [Ruminiclostridium sp.]